MLTRSLHHEARSISTLIRIPCMNPIAGCSPPERVDDDLVSIALEALNGQALDVHRAKLLLCSLMQPLCPSVTKSRLS